MDPLRPQPDRRVSGRRTGDVGGGGGGGADSLPGQRIKRPTPPPTTSSFPSSSSFKRPRRTLSQANHPEPAATAFRSRLGQQNGRATDAMPASTPDVYLCTYRKRQFKKHKTWDGDAYMLVDRSRHSIRLYECETDHLVASSSSFYKPVNVDDEFMLSGLEVQVADTSSYAEYRRVTRLNARKQENEPPADNPPPTFSKPRGSGGNPTFANPVLAQLVESTAASKHSSSFYTPSSSTTSTSHSKPQITSSYALTSKLRAAPRFDPHAPDAIVMKRPDGAHQKVFNPRGLPVVDVVVDPSLGKHLRPHQVDGVKFLYECVMGLCDSDTLCQGSILADEMGLGKTLQTIALIHTLLKQSPYWSPSGSTIQKAVVVCPLTLVKNWKREFHKWLGSSSINVLCADGTKNGSTKAFVQSKVYHVMIIGYEKLRSCVDQLQHSRPPIDLIVCDEGHRLKSRDAKTTKMFDLLGTRRRVILSGTPIQNDLSELHTMVNFVAPGLLNDYPTFKRVFEDAIVQSRVHGCTEQEAQLGRERSEMLKRATSNLILRRTASKLTGYLPPRTDMVVFCAPSKVQLQVYEAVVATPAANSLTNPLVLIGLLRKLCNSTRMLIKTKGEASNQFLTPDSRRLIDLRLPIELTSGKLAVLQALLQQIWTQTDDKVVIVSHFTSALDVVQHLLGDTYQCVRLDGQTKQDERQSLVNHFNRVPRSQSSFAFLLSAKSGGVGLNLIGANRLILLDSDWNPSTDLQAMARIHRDGQCKPCYIYRLLLSGTLDEKIYQRQLTKMALSDSLMDAGSSTTTSNTTKASDAFSPEELRDLFTLHTRTSCLTHEQLECDCLTVPQGNEAGDVDSSEDLDPDELDDANDDDVVGGYGDNNSSDGETTSKFVPATQRARGASNNNIKDQQTTLASLFSWAHTDSLSSSLAFVQDTVLQPLVSAAAALGTTAQDLDLHAVPGGTVLHVFSKDSRLLQ